MATWSSCYHEAGHAVASFYLGNPFNPEFIRCGDEIFKKCKPIFSEDFTDHEEILTLLAGNAAEKFSPIRLEHERRMKFEHPDDDMSQALDLARKSIPEAAAAYLESLLPEVNAIFDHTLPALRAIANELHKERSITGYQARAIYNREMHIVVSNAPLLRDNSI